MSHSDLGTSMVNIVKGCIRTLEGFQDKVLGTCVKASKAERNSDLVAADFVKVTTELEELKSEVSDALDAAATGNPKLLFLCQFL